MTKLINETTIINDNEVKELFTTIKGLIDQSRNRVYRTVNTEMINLYWNIGKIIVEKQMDKTGQNMVIILLKIYLID